MQRLLAIPAAVFSFRSPALPAAQVGQAAFSYARCLELWAMLLPSRLCAQFAGSGRSIAKHVFDAITPSLKILRTSATAFTINIR